MSEYKFKTKPYEHQLMALKKAWDKEYYAYFMEMGTGKSKVLIDEIASLYLRGKITAALIVAPIIDVVAIPVTETVTSVFAVAVPIEVVPTRPEGTTE